MTIHIFDAQCVSKTNLQGRRPATQNDVDRLQRLEYAYGHLLQGLHLLALTQQEAAQMAAGTYHDGGQMNAEQTRIFMAMEDLRDQMEHNFGIFRTEPIDQLSQNAANISETI